MSGIYGPPEYHSFLVVNSTGLKTTLTGKVAPLQCLALLPCQVDAYLHVLETMVIARPIKL